MTSLARTSLFLLGTTALVASFGNSSLVHAETLRAVPHAQLEVLDPIWTTAYITRTHGYLVYDTLFGLDENFEPQPQMVDTWSVSEDGLEWSFNLRPHQKWHDGADVTAADAVASLIRWGARDGVGQSLFSRISEMTATDDDTFAITLTRPYPLMLETLAKMSSNVPFIMPARIAATDPQVAITDATGSGPYKLAVEEWIPGEKVVYLRNELYVPRDEPTSLAAGAKVAFLDRIEWLSYPDQDAAVQALINDEVDYLESPSTSRLPMFEGQEAISVALTDTAGYVGMAVFNHAVAPFDNPDIRRAILTAMSQEDYMQAALGNPEYWQVCGSIYPCGSTYGQPTREGFFVSGDVDAARQMVIDAGYDGTPVIVIDPVDSPVISAFTGVSVDLLEAIGMTVDHQEVSWAELLQRRVVRTVEDGAPWNMFHTWWIAEDLSDPLRIAFSGDRDRGWIGWPEDATLETLRMSFLDAETQEERADIAAQVQDRIIENANFAVLGQFFEPIAFRNTVVGLQAPIQMYYNLAIVPQQ